MRSPQNPFNSLFDIDNLIVLLPILALKFAALNGCLIHTLGYLEMRLILSHFIEFLILGALPKSFISDFVLKSG